MIDDFGPDRYGPDALAGDWRSVGRKAVQELLATRDLVIEVVETGFCGAVLRIEGKLVHLEDFSGNVRVFPLGAGFLFEGEAVGRSSAHGIRFLCGRRPESSDCSAEPYFR